MVPCVHHNGLAEKWKEAGIDPTLIEPIEPLLDREMDFDDIAEQVDHVLINQLRIRGLKEWDGTPGPIVGYGHDGDGGQRLVVYPELGGVAVRLRENLESGSLWYSFPGDAQEVLTDAVR